MLARDDHGGLGDVVVPGQSIEGQRVAKVRGGQTRKCFAPAERDGEMLLRIKLRQRRFNLCQQLPCRFAVGLFIEARLEFDPCALGIAFLKKILGKVEAVIRRQIRCRNDTRVLRGGRPVWRRGARGRGSVVRTAGNRQQKRHSRKAARNRSRLEWAAVHARGPTARNGPAATWPLKPSVFQVVAGWREGL